MTPKEALNKLVYGQPCEPYITVLSDESLGEIIEQALTELEELKRYPTSEEVCEYLSSFYGRKVVYDNTKSNHVFYFEESKTIIAKLYYEGYINFATGDYHHTNNLPPHLITLIGRFYEGLEK